MQFELAPFDLPADYGEGIVTLENVKKHCHVLSSDFDTEMAIYRDAAVDMVERYCGVRLGELTGLVWKAESLSSPMCLGVRPLTAITGVAYLDSDGSDVTGDATIWRIGTHDTILLKPGQSLPTDVAAGVEITYSAGFTDTNRPKALVDAVLLFTAHLFKNREAVLTGTISGEIPLGFRWACNAYRMPVI